MHPWESARSAGLVFLFLVLLSLVACSQRSPDPSPAGPPGTAVETPEPPGSIPATPVMPPADRPDDNDVPQAEPDPAGTRQDVIDQQRALLREGRIERHIPREMQQGAVHTVRVRVGEGDAPKLEGPPAEIDVDQVLVGSDLVAELSGPDFEISRVGGDDGRRLLTSDGYTEWLWHVRPTTSGDLSLQVVLFVRLRDGSEPPLEVRTFSEEVTVSVTPWQLMGSFFENYGAATGLTIPVIVGALIAIVRFTRARRTAPSRSHQLGD
jgi:hypothetical protein